MRVMCAKCGKPMGELEGRLRRGWVLLCSDCYESEDRIKRDMPDFMKDLFKDKK